MRRSKGFGTRGWLALAVLLIAAVAQAEDNVGVVREGSHATMSFELEDKNGDDVFPDSLDARVYLQSCAGCEPMQELYVLPTWTITSTPTISPTPTATDTATLTPTVTQTVTGTPPTATKTPTGPTRTPTSTRTDTPLPTATAIRIEIGLPPAANCVVQAGLVGENETHGVSFIWYAGGEYGTGSCSYQVQDDPAIEVVNGVPVRPPTPTPYP